MAAIELTIKAMSLADLETTVAEINRRFRGAGEEEVETPPETASPAPAPGKPGRRRRAGGLLEDVSAAADAGAAGAVQAADDTADVEGAAGGEAAAVEPAEAAEADVAAPAEAEVDIFAEAEAETETEAQAADVQDPGAGEEITAEDIKTAVGELMEKKGFKAAQGVLLRHSVLKPGDTPAPLRAAVLADLRKAML